MGEFKLSRNGSGYYDETAYKGMCEMAKPGEIWSWLTNTGIRKEVLILKNHGTFCSALTLVDEDSADCIEVVGMGNYSKFTDPRMVQYVYNSNFAQFITVVSGEDFVDILNVISCALSIPNITRKSSEDTEQTISNHRDCFEEMIALLGVEAVRNYCKCRYMFHLLHDEADAASKYMQKLKELGGDDR